MTDTQRTILKITDHIFYYQDDPFKPIYRTTKGDHNALKFISRGKAAEFTAEEQKLISGYREIAEAIPFTPNGKWKDKAANQEVVQKLMELFTDDEYRKNLAHAQMALLEKDFNDGAPFELDARKEEKSEEKRKDPEPSEEDHGEPEPLEEESSESEGPKEMPQSREQALARRNGHEDTAMTMSEFAGEYKFTRAQVDLFKSMYAVNATDDEMKMFLYTCYKLNLDPAMHQIHFIKRRRFNNLTKKYEDVASIQVGIDGYRAIADRTGKWSGEEVTSEGEEEEKIGELVIKHPVKSIAKIYRKGWAMPVVREVYWNEYAQHTKDGHLQGLWLSKPHVMLEKCAEAIALRTAFPEQLSGTYGEDEMGGKE